MWTDFKLPGTLLAGTVCLFLASPIQSFSQEVTDGLSPYRYDREEAKTTSAPALNLSFLEEASDYLWPTDASPYISSTFGETRSAHFHAGLDIRTWGQEGYRVFATKDGIVCRIGIGPRGYGKVVYLRHDDGSFSVYAHLNRFEPSLQSLADSIRMQDYSFELDKVVTGHNIRVKQGDLIGYSGSTGVGPPHLHFELRTPDNQPFNPLLTNLGVDDTLPPVFSSLAVEHLSSASFETEHIERVRASGKTPRFHFGTVRASGPVGLAVDVYDRANRTSNAYAVYHLTVVHEGDTLFHSQTDTFSYIDASQMFIDRVYPILKEHRKGYQRLFVVNGNTLPFYPVLRNRGVIDLPEGRHELEIIASDYYGNRSRAGVTLEVAGREQPARQEITGVPAYSSPDRNRPSGKIQDFSRLDRRILEPVYFVDASAGTDGSAASAAFPPSTTLSDPNTIYQLYRDRTTHVLGKTLVPGKRQLIHLPDQSIWLDFPEDALFDTLDIQVRIEDGEEGPTIQFSPESLPLKNGIYVNIILPEQHDIRLPAGLYTYDPHRDRHRLVSKNSGGHSSRFLRAEINELQPLVVKHDGEGPEVGTPRIQSYMGGKAVVAVPALDELSGIDYQRSTITVNGRRAIVEYEPDKDRLIYYRPDFQLQPVNQVDIRIFDGIGNVSERSVNLDTN